MPVSPPAPTAAFLIDPEGRISSWNPSCEQLFGRPTSETVSQPLSILLTAQSAAKCATDWPPQALLALTGTVAQLQLMPQFSDDGAFHGCVASVTLADQPPASEAEKVRRTPLAAIVDAFAGTFYIIDRNSRFVLWNRNLERYVEMTPEQLARANALDLFDEADKMRVEQNIRAVFEEGVAVMVEANCKGQQGTVTPFLLCGSRIECDAVPYLCGLGFDISERRAQETKLRLLERALHAASNGILITRCCGADNVIEYVNPAFERITAYPAAEALGRDARFLAAPELDKEDRARLREAIHERHALNVVFRNQRRDGTLFWNDLTITPVLNEAGVATHYIGVLDDVTASRQRTADLEHEVNHDALTGLANRNLLWDRLGQALHVAQRNKTMVATLMLDLDHFKQINDSFGHDAGDEVLTAMARRLQAAVRESDTVARLSGDEFVLVLSNQPSLRYTMRMIDRLRSSIAKPVAFDNKQIPVGASIGVSVYPHDGNNVFDLVRAADVAMYHAKSAGKGDAHFFSTDMTSCTAAKAHMETAMRRGLENGEFFLLFQPRLNLVSGKVSSVEALLRWRHPERGTLLPADFLAEAEDNGLIVPIGARVLDLVCDLLTRFKLGGHALPVAMNASFRELNQQDYARQIGERLGRLQLAPGCLELDVSEEDLLRNPELGRSLADELHAIGVKLSVDEFGDGMSSLSYLESLDLCQLKLARASVGAICGTAKAGPLAKATIDIAHDLSLRAIAEGVENQVQLDFLRTHGCDAAQGNFLSAPLGVEALEQFIDAPHELFPAAVV
ncbi:MAG: EAL domain-containing protein [Pseudomonadota bacterium]